MELVPVNKHQFLRDSRAEMVPAEGCLYYDQDLDNAPLELLEVLAHELAHLVLHHRSFVATGGDLILGSVFLGTGAPALSRYSPRSREEAEANAFAAEFICPASEVFEKWQRGPSSSAGDLADYYQATPALIRLQLAQGLFRYIAGDEREEEEQEASSTPEQERAATACGSPILLDAGPGTGKTKTLIRRIIHLLKEKSEKPERLLVLTFSNEASAEIQKRLCRYLGEHVASRVLALTFHGYGVVLLNKLGHHIGLNVDFTILDETCQQELISGLLAEAGCDALLNIKNPEATALEVVNNINYLKDRLIGPEELKLSIAEWKPRPDERAAYKRAEALLRLFELYERRKKDLQQVDFADLILLPYRLLVDSPELKNRIREEFRWVMVDEYQDVSRATALFLQQICGSDNPPWVVGDARQAIYRFRGAEPENVRAFGRDFPGAEEFQLTENYRSTPEIISILNHLAIWFDDPDHIGPATMRWRPGKRIQPVRVPAITLGVAKSDAAERMGIVSKISEWLAQGVQPEHVAVLARRNIDVRNLAIDLKRHGIRAVTSGLLTAEGAGGDLAAVLTAIDHRSALPRLVYALGRTRFTPSTLNEIVKQLLPIEKTMENQPREAGDDPTRIFVGDVLKYVRRFNEMLHTADGWVAMCDFLFFSTSYLKQLIESDSDPVSAVQLEEVLSSLSLAVNYRFGHRHVQPRRSRLGLAEKMRDLVTESAPGLIAPGSRVGAVRVMTCHASKGLEFQCAAVAGQSLSEIRPAAPCLPPSLRASADDDLAQAESLLFVGISRAQRGAVVSYALSASGTPRSKPRRFPRLLTRLQDSGLLPIVQWVDSAPVSGDVTVGRIWGGRLPEHVSLYCLSSSSCQLKAYLEDQIGTRFSGRQMPLYPEFIVRVRKMLRRVVDQRVNLARPLSDAEISEIFEEEWPVEKYRDHPHVYLYRPRAERWTKALAAVFAADCRRTRHREETLEWKDSTGGSHTVRLQLIGHFEDDNGGHIAIALQVNSPDDAKATINWSELKDYERLPFVLLQELNGDLQPVIFCGEEGALRTFRWNRQRPDESITKEASAARATFASLESGNFRTAPNDWTCDHCSCRVVCPWWMGAAD
jgi:superfamily I DNA/RNA helicase